MAGKGGKNDLNSERLCKHCRKKVSSPLDCESCGSSYHPSCATQAKVSDGKNVNCCKERVKEPVEVQGVDFAGEMNEVKLRGIIGDLLNKFFSPIKKTIEGDLAELRHSIQHMSECFDEQRTSLARIVSEMGKLRDENALLKRRVETLETKLDLQEQRERQNNIVVVGVPKQPEQDTKGTIRKVMESMRLQVREVDIEAAYRVGKREDGPILLKLKNGEIKQTIFERIRQIKGIKVKECGLQGNDRNIYFNEDLTHHNQLLFKKAREFRKISRCEAVYCRGGKIYLRKDKEGASIRIRSESDLRL